MNKIFVLKKNSELKDINLNKNPYFSLEGNLKKRVSVEFPLMDKKRKEIFKEWKI